MYMYEGSLMKLGAPSSDKESVVFLVESDDFDSSCAAVQNFITDNG